MEVVCDSGRVNLFGYGLARELCWGHLLGFGDTVDDPHAGLGEALSAHVAARDDPLVVLFREDRADETNHRRPVREDPDDV